MTEDIPIKYIAGLDAYQDEAFKTAVFPPEIGPLYCAMGILGEAGEMVDVVLGVMDRAIEENPEFNTKDLQWITSQLKEAVKVCSAIEVIKKHARKGRYKLKPIPSLTDGERDRIRAEGGDGLWYAGVMARVAGWQLSDVAQGNIKKLRERRDAGVIASAGETIKERKANA